MNHYIFIEPGERVFIMLDKVAGDNDHTYVLELTLPSVTVHGEARYDHKPAEIVLHETLELNECCNLTADGSDLLSAYQESHEQGLEDGEECRHDTDANGL